jgi:hypothetical protein
MRLTTPLQALMTCFLMKAENTKSLSAAQQLVKTVVGGTAGFELCLFAGARGDHVPSGKMPDCEDYERA